MVSVLSYQTLAANPCLSFFARREQQWCAHRVHSSCEQGFPARIYFGNTLIVAQLPAIRPHPLECNSLSLVSGASKEILPKTGCGMCLGLT